VFSLLKHNESQIPLKYIKMLFHSNKISYYWIFPFFNKFKSTCAFVYYF